MNFNASRNVGQPGNIRKAKRVSHVAAMGAPSPTPQFPASSAYNPGFPAAGAPPPYQEGIQFDSQQTFGSAAPTPNFSYATPQSSLPSTAQLGSMLHQPVVQDMAYQYGHQLATQGREAVRQHVHKYVPVSRLRYYFAVDTNYVLKKLLRIIFPFTNKEWLLKYDQESPVQPRYDLNAPDLYIPTMGYVTYVLLTGFVLGLQRRFSPEQISIQASSALAYIIFEMIMYLATLYITNTHTNLRTLDLLAFSGYKYVPMIGALLCGLVFGKTGYYCSLVYSSLALSYFLVKTLRMQVLGGPHKPEPASAASAYRFTSSLGYSDNQHAAALVDNIAGARQCKRRVYFLLFVAVTQPLLSWWLTYHLVPTTPVLQAPAR